MVVFASKQSRFRSVGNIPIKRLQEGWEQAKEGLTYAINFLSTNAEIEDESLLSSPFLFIPVAVYSQLHGGKVSRSAERQLLYWLHLANARGRFSRGSSETLLDSDLSILFNGGPLEKLTEQVQQQFGRSSFDPGELAGRGPKNPVFPIVFLALKRFGAKDWHSGLKISLAHQGKLHYIQFHHIFSKALLRGKYPNKEINEIANMAFIAGRTNQKLGKKEPCDYFPGIIKERGENALTSQGVPLDPELHRIENFQRFLEVRRETLARHVNDYIESAMKG
jgi:hypothetical protein